MPDSDVLCALPYPLIPAKGRLKTLLCSQTALYKFFLQKNRLLFIQYKP
ncbi:hypothetical protein NEIFLAOT_02458 [Neisseria flavescens NRL30031/H210]|uniref:Uncharacterized protein n=1 Tax=Neisseria flavescens NRL30031/H210 TaxID=546264 RepID=C0ER58_NEIFL|nr:hypothetical protein NEIFLAOT_02458 [Neisseria flavescens NRL30031/H210]